MPRSLNTLESPVWRQRLPWFFLATALLLCGYSGLRLFQAQQRFVEMVGWRARTYEMLRALDGAMTSIQELDSTQRGYLVTGNAAYLKNRADAQDDLKSHFARARELSFGNPARLKDLDELERLEGERLAVEAEVIRAKDTQGIDAMLQVIKAGRGKGGMGDIRAVHKRMVDEELRLLELRQAAIVQGRDAAARSMALLALASLLLVAMGLGMLLRLRRERALHEAAWKRNTAILDSTPDFIGTMDPTGRVTYWNPALRKLHGLDPEGPAEELAGWTAFRAHTTESAARLRDIALPAAAAEGAWSGESTFLDARGRPIPVSQVILAHKNRAGRVVAFSSIARDIREQKATERLKNDFVSTVNHELRTPLTSIRGSLGLLLAAPEGTLTDSARQMVEIAHRNSDRLSRIIDDILDLEKLEAEGMEFHRESLPLDPLLAQAAEAMRPLCEGRGLRLDCPPAPQAWRVFVDEGRFLQVLANLLSNAAKFSSPGGTVGLRARPAPGIPGWIRLEVEDAGPGVPESFRPRIFQKFSQASSPTGERQGTGLGLSIAKTIIERLGGRIGFESEPGRTVFWVELPEMKGEGGVNLEA